MATLLDNRTHGKVGDALADIGPNVRLSMLSNRFSVYAFSLLKQQLTRAASVRILLPGSSGLPAPLPDAPFRVAELAGSEADRRFRNTLTIARVARECAEWIEQKARIKAVLSPIPQNLFHVAHDGGPAFAIQGSSPFTSSGLGFTPSAAYDMNTWFTAEDATAHFLRWFDGIWHNREITRDATSAVLAQLAEIYSSKSAELLYFLTLYHTFRDLLGELEEERIIKTRTGIKDTLIWSKLYRFQRDGVLGAIDKIERYNGCILADSVGLGKTYEALAIIKYYELRNDRVLVLCPKRLRENWTLYTMNDRRNLFAADRFNFDVLNHTDLSRTGGFSGDLNLETVNWGNYDLVVIDESHNFRNNPPRKDGLTRYARLMRDIIQAGVKTKVLMLSATPVNSRMNDLKNQVAFITEGKDDALSDYGIASIEQTLRRAQTRFNQWLGQDATERTVHGLLEALNFDYFKLLDLLTIARSRKHVAKYYDMAEIGKFPERAKPINIKAAIDTKGDFPELSEINREIRRLNLSAYTPLKYVLPHRLEEYSRRYDMAAGGAVFRQIDREKSLIHLMRVNLFKRMESSIHSFTRTVERLLGDVRDLIKRLDSDAASSALELRIEEIEEEDKSFNPYLIGSKVKVLLQDVDRVRWRQELEEDEELLARLLWQARTIDAARDEKLHRLQAVIAGKCQQPINSGNRKVLIFTAFADTAEYLYAQMAPWAREERGLHVALVTGRTGGNRTTMPNLRKDLASILTATDCISEGQNLQDCDWVINYDIHWNPVRIIQRFGRIDRLGSRNQVIQLVNFWPNMELDEYINLEARVSGRMVLLESPQRAVLVERDGEERLYFVVESKGSFFTDAIRPVEQAKIDCGRAHFRALGNDLKFEVAASFELLRDRFVG